VTRSMTVGIVSGRGNGRDQFERGKVMLHVTAGRSDDAAHCQCWHSSQAAGQVVHSERKEPFFP
jgi:hypothetical protein